MSLNIAHLIIQCIVQVQLSFVAVHVTGWFRICILPLQWFVYWPGLSGHWDLYLISVLVGVVIILALWRTRH